jgi:hypothetical protein
MAPASHALVVPVFVSELLVKETPTGLTHAIESDSDTVV